MAYRKELSNEFLLFFIVYVMVNIVEFISAESKGNSRRKQGIIMDEAKLEAARAHIGVKVIGFIGEEAWHYAWKVLKDGNELVLRIPKEETRIRYGSKEAVEGILLIRYKINPSF